MIKNFTEEQFEQASGDTELELICRQCNNIFKKSKRKLQRVGNASCKTNYDYCSRACASTASGTVKTYACRTCGKQVQRSRCAVTGNVFCSSSCAAKYNNSASPKRKRKPRYCSSCHEPITRVKYCKGCLDKRREDLLNTPLRDIQKLPYQINSKVRAYARTYAKQQGLSKVCQVCGYTKHVEIHHKKPISSFDPNTPVSVVNDVSNIAVLCPNCHWEADHGLLELL